VPEPHPALKINWILGSPRSGTTWLGKIFDSHPDVVYRNEPDGGLPSDTLPLPCRVEDLECYRDVASAYLNQLIDMRTLGSSGSLPVFRKSYQSPTAYGLRLGIVHGLHLLNFATRGTRWQYNKVVPEIIDRARCPQPIIVIKSVSAHSRARLFLEALPGSRIVIIIRHPCAHVVSILRGLALGKFGNQSLLQDLRRRIYVRRFVRRHQLSELVSADQTQQPDDLVEQLAWNWATLNQKMIDDLTGLCSVRIVRYEDLVKNPAAVARELFAFAGLTWNPQTAAFILKSTTFKGRDRYWGLKKNSNAMLVKWHKQLSSDDQCRILDIARSVPIGRLFEEVDQDEAAILPNWAREGGLYKSSPARARCAP
jgi:Sulfotransferase family